MIYLGLQIDWMSIWANQFGFWLNIWAPEHCYCLHSTCICIWDNRFDLRDSFYDGVQGVGKNTIVADALLRWPHLSLLVEITADWKQEIIIEYANNQFATRLVDGTLHDGRYQMDDDLIDYKGRIFLVPDSKLKKRILQSFHDIPLAGHQGYFKSYRQIQGRFSWKGLKDEALRYIIVFGLPTEQRYTHFLSWFAAALTYS